MWVYKNKGPYTLSFDIYGTPPKATNKLLGRGWRAKHSNAVRWKKFVALAVGAQKPKAPLKRAQLKLIRYAPRTLDYDGLVASMKPVVDGLVECGVLIDDRWSVTGVWKVFQAYAPAAETRIRVEVLELSEDAGITES